MELKRKDPRKEPILFDNEVIKVAHVLAIKPEKNGKSYYTLLVERIAECVNDRQNLCDILEDGTLKINETIKEIFFRATYREFVDLHPHVYFAAVEAGLSGRYNRPNLKLFVDIATLGNWVRNYIFDLAKYHDQSNELAPYQFWYNLKGGSYAAIEWAKIERKIQSQTWLYNYDNYNAHYNKK